jgi:hypothetical protein
MDDFWITFALWTAAALLLGWTWIPAIIAGLGGSRYANGGLEDPAALTPGASEPDYARRFDEITALGYEPLGAGWMRITFHGSEWRYETRVRAFYSRNKQTYVFVQKQPPPLDVWWLTMFATVWKDGGLLLTSNAMDEPPGDGDYVVQGIESDRLEIVEQLHLAHVQRLRQQGRQPETDGQLDTLLQATRRHSGPAARHLGLKLGQTYFASHGLIHTFLTIPAAYMSGLGHWSVPMMNLILGLMLAGSERLARRRAGGMMRAQVLQQTTLKS